MSDPMNTRPVDPPPPPAPPPPPPSSTDGIPPRRTSPVVWLLLLALVLAAAWYWYNRGAVDTTPPPDAQTATMPAGPAIGSEQEAAAEAERERAAATERRRESSPKAPKPVADRDATPVARVQPAYPAEAARVKAEGSVTVKVEVDANGIPTSVTLAKRSGERALDEAALEAVRQWRFQPAIRNGKPVASTVEVPVDFTME